MKKHYQKLLSKLIVSTMLVSQLASVVTAQEVVPFYVENDYVINPLTREDILSVEASNEWLNPEGEFVGNDYSGSMLFDNNKHTVWQTTGAALTIANPELAASPVTLTLTLKEAKTIRRIDVTSNKNADGGFDGSVKDYTIEMGSSLGDLRPVKVAAFDETAEVQSILFDEMIKDVQVIRFTARSAVSENLSLSDMTIFSAEPVEENAQGGRVKLDASTIVSVDATSVDGTHGAELAVDDNKNTYWKSEEGAVGAGLGTYYNLELNKSYNIKEISLLPIQQDSNNGGIKSYELYVSNDKNNMGSPVKVGELPFAGGLNRKAESIVLDNPVNGKYVKLHIKSGVGDKAAIADLGIYINAKEESDTTLRYAAVDVKGITHEFDIEFGKTRFEHQVPFVLEEGDIVFTVQPNSKTATVSEPVKEGSTYHITVTAEDGTETVYQFSVTELSQRGSEIPIIGVSGTGKHYGNDTPDKAKDGDFTSKWQAYTPEQGYEKPTLLLELDRPQPVQSLTMHFRQDHKNGGVTAYEVWGGNDPANLTLYKVGELDTPYEKEKAPQTVELNIADEVKYIQLCPINAHEIAAITEVFLYEPVPLGTNAEITFAEYSLDNGVTWSEIGVNPDMKDYTVTLNPFEERVPKLRVKTRNIQSEVNMKVIHETEGSVKVEVISQDGTIKNNYTFRFEKRPADTNIALKTVLYNNQNLVLKPGQTAYEVEVPEGTQKVDIVAIPQSQYATVKINGKEVEVVQMEKVDRYVSVQMNEGRAIATIDVAAEDKVTTESYTIEFVENKNTETAYYEQDFSDPEKVDWQKNMGASDNVNAEIVDGALKITSIKPVSGRVPYTDMNSPAIKDGKISFDLIIGEEVANPFGIILRGNGATQVYTALAYENGKEGPKWYIQNNNGWSKPLFLEELKPNTTYSFEIEMQGDALKITLNGEQKFQGKTTSAGGAEGTFKDIEGQFGYLTWFGGDPIAHIQKQEMTIDNIIVQEAKKPVMQPARPVDAKDITLSLGEMDIIVDSAFPRIMEYKLDGKTAFIGQEEFVSGVRINDRLYYPAEVSYSVNEASNKINYVLTFDKQGENGEKTKFVELDVEIALSQDGHSKDDKYANNIQAKDRNIIDMKVTDIREFDSSEQVATLEFAEQNLLTISGEGAGYAAIKAAGGHSGLSEVHGTLADIVPYKVSKEKLTYPLIFNDNYAAAIHNNVIVPENKIMMTKNGIYNTLGFANGGFTYRFQEGVFANNTETEALPETRIIIGGEQNKDNQLDWQDAAVLFREIMPMPKASEDIKDHVWWIAMNFTSTTSNPFLRVLDNSKMLSHYYDGFGQMILNKGYQGEGHDDSHPDYAEVGIRQGGAKDFNILGEAGDAYNVKTGIHINATEYMLDALNTKLENLQGGELGKLDHGWAWLDASYHVDQMKDLESGELERRLDELDKAVPTLDFVYVDVYYRSDYHSNKFAEKMNEKWAVATEFAGPFEGNQIFTHWGTDLYYPGSGLGSDIYRFLYNGYKDAFNPDELLKGMQMPGVASWRGVTNMFEGVEIFYNQNLPTKYMQYSPIVRMTDNRVDFENGSYVAKENGRVNLYSKDKNLIAQMTEDATRCKSTVFIPWNPVTEDKIYYWNNDGGETTWTLPDSWEGKNEVYVYELTSTGRKFIEAIPVNSNEVTLNYKAQVPYIIEDSREDTNGLPQDTEWGEGSLVKDPGFNSMAFGKGQGQWQKYSKSNTTDHIEMIRMEDTELYDNKLKVSGKEDALIAQEITGLEPGKTYTVSAWANTERLVELGMLIDDEVYSVDIDNNHIVSKMKDHKYSGKNYQRIRFDVVVPEGVTKAQMYLHVPADEEGRTAIIDDIRIFEQPGHTEREKDDAIYFEDFENVDEGWGVFEYALNGGSSKVHMARRDPEGKQIKSYAFDGEWSLKVSDNKTGEVIITYPSHIEFQPNTEYTVAFDYTLFAETKGETLLADERYPYTLSAKDAKGNVLSEVTLTPSKLGTGENGGNKNHDPSVETVEITFTTPDTIGTYITVSTPNGMPNGAGGSTSTALNTLMIDNVAIYSEGHDKAEAVLPDYPIFDDNDGNNGGNDGNGGNGGNDGNGGNGGNTGGAGSGNENTTEKEKEEVISMKNQVKDRIDSLAPGEVDKLEDITGHWAEEMIRTVVQKGLMVGRTAESFAPNETLKRAEIASIIARVIGDVEGEAFDYVDIKEDKWYTEAVQTVSAAGILNGYPDGSFKPEQAITRMETAVVLVSTLEHLELYEAVDVEAVLARFEDGHEVPEWAKAKVAWAIENKLMSGYPDGTLRVGNTVSRAETASMLQGFLKVIE